MRSKYRRRVTAAPPRGSTRSSRALRVVSIAGLGLGLLVIGVSVGVLADQFVSSSPGSGKPATTAPPAQVVADASPLASAEPAVSASPSAAPSPAAPVLEAEMPHAINGTTLTIQSATDATSLGSGPSNRALNAAMTSLGKTPADLEIAEAYDASGAINASVLGFRVAGVDPAKLRSLILDVWLPSTTPGVTTSSVTLSGTLSTKVTYGDGGPDEYVVVHGDSVFLVETMDPAMAASAVVAMAAPQPSPTAGS